MLDHESRNRRALEAIENIHFRREDWKKLFETYEKLVDVADTDAEMADIYARMARISLRGARTTRTRRSSCGAACSTSAARNRRRSRRSPSSATRREKWEELVEIIERQVAVAPGDDEQIRLYKQLGNVWEDKLGRERNALDAWLAADRLDGNDLETLRSLARLYRSTQAWDELSADDPPDHRRRPASRAIDENETIELYAQLGQLEGEVLGRVDEAVEAWRRVIAIDPSDFRALAALEGLFTREGRWEEAIDVLEKRALVLDDEDQRRDTLLQAAVDVGREGRGPRRRAAQVYERVRASRPGEHRRVRSARGDLSRSSTSGPSSSRSSSSAPSCARTSSEQIRMLQPGRARSTRPRSATRSPRSTCSRPRSSATTRTRRPRSELERLATATNRWQELLDEYTNRVNELEREDRGAAADLWVKIGRWYGEHLSHLEYAIHSVQQALRIDPGAHRRARRRSRDLQRKRGSWSELIETLQRHAGVETDADKKTDLYIQPRRAPRAPDAGRPRRDPRVPAGAGPRPASSAPALVALDRLYRRTEQWEPLIDVLTKRARASTDEPTIVRLPARDRPDLGPPPVRRRPVHRARTRPCSTSIRRT